MKKIIILVLVFCYSCKKKDNKPVFQQEQKIDEQFSYKPISNELLKNVNFKNWDTNSKPEHWQINNQVDEPENFVVDRDTLDLLLKGHKSEEIYIEQSLKIEPDVFYLFEADVETNLKHNSNSGMFIKSKEKTLAKRVFKTRTRDTYRVIFKTQEKTQDVNCYIGFSKPEEGSIMIKRISLKKVEINEFVYDSELAQNFFDVLELNFSNEQSFDESVAKISKNISDLLISRQRKDSVSMKRVDNLLPLLKYDDKEEYAFLKRDLSVPIEKITHSYQSKLVFGNMEILREFNIGTKRIDVYKNGNRIHLLFKYYNPFSEKWIIVDPFYNSTIKTSTSISAIKKEDVTVSDYGGLSKNLDGLISKYSRSEIKVMNEKVISFPF